MGGCYLNRPVREIVYKAGDWDLEASTLKEVPDPALPSASLMPRVEGRMLKRVLLDYHQ
jgi:hypothetical protein